MQPPMPMTTGPSLPRREGAYIERAKLRHDSNVGMKKKSVALLAKLIAAVVACAAHAWCVGKCISCVQRLHVCLSGSRGD